MQSLPFILLHFAAFILFSVSVIICGDYYILRRAMQANALTGDQVSRKVQKIVR